MIYVLVSDGDDGWVMASRSFGIRLTAEEAVRVLDDARTHFAQVIEREARTS